MPKNRGGHKGRRGWSGVNRTKTLAVALTPANQRHQSDEPGAE